MAHTAKDSDDEEAPRTRQLTEPSKRTFPALIAVNVLQIALAKEVGSLELPAVATIALGATVSGTLCGSSPFSTTLSMESRIYPRD